MGNFIFERNKKCINSLSKNLEKLPDYCLDFFLAIENYTSALTRLNYSYDLCIFFDYLLLGALAPPPN